MPSHNRKWLAMIRDMRAGQPRPATLPGAANVDRRHRSCCPPCLHHAMIAAALTIAAVFAVAAVAPVLLVIASAAADEVSPQSQSFHRCCHP